MRNFPYMATKSWEELLPGISKFPLRYGRDLEIGSGTVVPEIKYFPRRDLERETETLMSEYRDITDSILKRATNLGLTSIQLETEQSFLVTKNPKLGREITNLQKTIIDKYSDEYGIKCGLRVTIADIREPKNGIRESREVTQMFESFESAAESGADVLSIESTGGKEVFNYSLIRQDLEGVLFSVGVLGSLDMEFLWKEIVKIAKKHGIVPGGDTDCAHSNSAMIMAEGLIPPINISHTFAAVVRAMGAARSLVAYEQGATGPGKDCGYENVIIKAITGYPMSMEGKSSASAHSSLVGNVAAAACDLWSNEQVENVKLYGGWAPQVFTEILGYDALLMNAAAKRGLLSQIRDLLTAANPEDPQVTVISPEIAWKIGHAITEHPNDYYLRSKNAALEAIKAIRETSSNRNPKIVSSENRVHKNIEKFLEDAPADYSTFLNRTLAKYVGKIENFSPKNYGL